MTRLRTVDLGPTKVKVTVNDLSDFVRAYIAAALWTTVSEDDNGNRTSEFLDGSYSADDLTDEALAKVMADCKAFQDTTKDVLDGLKRIAYNDSYAGHDFWLTRNGHGAGFWDRPIGKLAQTYLTDEAKKFGTQDFVVGDDDCIHVF